MLNWSMIISIIITELALGLHYLPITPISFGLILTGPLYALVDFASTSEQKRTRENIWIGLVIMVIFLVLAMLWGI